MVFRKDSLLFYQCRIFYIIMGIASLLFIPTVGLELFLLYVSIPVLLFLLNPQMYNEFITINEMGISCHRSKKLLWSYEWDRIAELRKSSRYLLPAIEVITFNKHGEPEQYALPAQYFQLGKAAKEAIKQYYKPAGQSLNL